MSMKWVEGFNHNMQHIKSENPSECPTATTVFEPSMYYQCGVASL
jgi:hypothetical protein